MRGKEPYKLTEETLHTLFKPLTASKKKKIINITRELRAITAFFKKYKKP